MRCLIFVALLVTVHSAGAEAARLAAGRVVWFIPEALRLIRTADEVYILPVTFTEKPVPAGKGAIVAPHGDYKHLRSLSADARRKLAHLLGNESNWFHGFDSTFSVDRPSKNVGFVFRKGKDEMVLLCGLGSRLEGTFNGEHTGGSLEKKPFDQLKEWKKQYANPELR